MCFVTVLTFINMIRLESVHTRCLQSGTEHIVNITEFETISSRDKTLFNVMFNYNNTEFNVIDRSKLTVYCPNSYYMKHDVCVYHMRRKFNEPTMKIISKYTPYGNNNYIEEFNCRDNFAYNDYVYWFKLTFNMTLIMLLSMVLNYLLSKHNYNVNVPTILFSIVYSIVIMILCTTLAQNHYEFYNSYYEKMYVKDVFEIEYNTVNFIKHGGDGHYITVELYFKKNDLYYKHHMKDPASINIIRYIKPKSYDYYMKFINKYYESGKILPVYFSKEDPTDIHINELRNIYNNKMKYIVTISSISWMLLIITLVISSLIYTYNKVKRT